jgi:hypothetical protein
MYGAPHAFLSTNEKELPKDLWGTTQHPQCQQGTRDGALYRRSRNPPNYQQLPHAMEHIPGYVQQSVCGYGTAASKPPFGSRRPRDAQNATTVAAGNSHAPKPPSYRHPLRQQGDCHSISDGQARRNSTMCSGLNRVL